ncbi:MAG: excisionase family protein [Mojavia pulchra JT2-VF2]|uniref:Excisionase family protein n=1 Tax=Mojavia pulchra JT2-VF2 TaxID=287848 RepID=A0A951UDZ0_9NOST|nr:excisionase family protein [Mojavia pulchra JT2-VF2]
MNNFVTKKQLSNQIGLSSETFKRYRLQGIWQESIHWQKINSRTTLYNLPLILDWIANRDNPQAHQRAIEAYLHSLPSNQPLKRGRKVS